MEPSIGRVVHYVSHGSPVRDDGTQEFTSRCRAAIITDVEDPVSEAGGGIVSLAVLNPTGVFFGHGVSHVNGENMVGGSWHWPERVDA